jgi:hypothetical protein
MERLRKHSPAYDVIIACATGEMRERGGRDSWQQLPVMGGNARLIVSCVLGRVETAVRNRKGRDSLFSAVFRTRIHRIHVFFGILDPDPLGRGMDPDPALDTDPSIIMQK